MKGKIKGSKFNGISRQQAGFVRKDPLIFFLLSRGLRGK